MPATVFDRYLWTVVKNRRNASVGLPKSLGLPVTYFLSLILLYPLLIALSRTVFNSQMTMHPVWERIQFLLSGPGLIYLGLVIMRLYKPVPRRRKILGLCLFLIGFGWLFEILALVSKNGILS